MAVVLAAAACEGPPAPPASPPPTTTTPTAARPPQPVMASPAWGERVALDLGKDVVANDGVTAMALVQQGQQLLLGLEPGSEVKAAAVLLQAWKTATDDQTRGLALALVAVAMVWDPTVEGYVERLTDAYGLALYAGTVDTTSAIGQAARGIVAAAGGSTRQARDLIDMLARMPRQPDDLPPWLALTRAAATDRRQAFFDEAEIALKVNPAAWRVRAALADRLVDIGLAERAVAATTVDGKEAPAAVVLVRARAKVLANAPKEARAILEPLTAALAGVDEPRRSEGLYWLAEAQLGDGDVTAAKTTATSLEARPGWRRESAFLAASFALHDGRLEDAKALLLPLVAGTPTSTVPVERRIGRLTLDVCAELKDTAGFEKAERFLQVVDVDPEGVAAARLRLGRDGSVAARSGVEIWSAVTRPGAAVLGLQAARRAVASNANGLARPLVLELVKAPGARAARALRVALEEAPAEQAKAAVLALKGQGPELNERDVLGVIDGLAAAPTPEGQGLLEGLGKDARPAVKKAAERALDELKNPDARARRLKDAEDSHEHGADPSRHVP